MPSKSDNKYLDNNIMVIRLETAKRTGIENSQQTEISAFEANWAKSLKNKYPNIIPRTDLNPRYNCHGLTFASRRTKIISPNEIQKIIKDDEYTEIPLAEVKAGDIVVYYSEKGDANHSGIVVSGVTTMNDDAIFTPLICSKWGVGGEFIHGLNDCPTLYGPVIKFYR